MFMWLFRVSNIYLHVFKHPSITVNILCPGRGDVIFYGPCWLLSAPFSFSCLFLPPLTRPKRKFQPGSKDFPGGWQSSLYLLPSLLPAAIFLYCLDQFSGAMTRLDALWMISDSAQYSLHSPATNHKAISSNLWVIINPCSKQMLYLGDYRQKPKECNCCLIGCTNLRIFSFFKSQWKYISSLLWLPFIVVEFLEFLLLGAHEQRHLNSHIVPTGLSFSTLALTSIVAQMASVCEAPSVALPTGRDGNSISHGAHWSVWHFRWSSWLAESHPESTPWGSAALGSV